jgi:hypothetical protein
MLPPRLSIDQLARQWSPKPLAIHYLFTLTQHRLIKTLGKGTERNKGQEKRDKVCVNDRHIFKGMHQIVRLISGHQKITMARII